MGLEAPIHVLLVCFTTQSNINTMLRFGKSLAAKGLLVTFSTTEDVGKKMKKSNDYITITEEPTPIGHGFFRFEFFQDGLPEDDPQRSNIEVYLPQLEIGGRESLPKLIKKQSDEGRPVSCLVNSPFFPWVCDVAEELGIPCAMLWVQSCALLAAYYHYFHKTVPFPSEAQPEIDVKLPGMPVLRYFELPAFLLPSSPYKVLWRALLKQMDILSKCFCVLIGTFDELERDIIQEMSKFCRVRTIGPSFKEPKESLQSTTNIRGDLLTTEDDCIEWLDTKPPATVVYISFGSIAYLDQEQVDEIAHALLNSGVSFLWVMRPPFHRAGAKPQVLPEGFFEKTGDKGRVVKWCPQEKVLAHPSVICFVTHCGWNSTMEAITYGVPVVTFPFLGDQLTNTKFLVNVWGVGVRFSRSGGEKRVISREEIEKCLMEVMVGEKAAELKRNALNWKLVAEEAVAEGGSSNLNIRDFIEEIRNRSRARSVEFTI